MNPFIELVTSTLQGLEEFTRTVLEAHGYECDFRKIFRNKHRKFEIDVIAKNKHYILAIDCKRYIKTKSRANALKKESKKHFERCVEYTIITKEYVIPVIVTLLDDSLFSANGCIVIPVISLNDFLLHIDNYLEILIENPSSSNPNLLSSLR